MSNALAERLEAALRRHNLAAPTPAKREIQPVVSVLEQSAALEVAVPRFGTVAECLAADLQPDEDGIIAVVVEQQSWPSTLPYAAGNYTLEDAQRVAGGFLVHISR